MLELYDQNSPKKSITIRINSDLLKKSQDLKINLSATLEEALANQLKTKQAQQWLDKNKSSIAAYNKPIKENGVFSDELRSF